MSAHLAPLIRVFEVPVAFVAGVGGAAQRLAKTDKHGTIRLKLRRGDPMSLTMDAVADQLDIPPQDLWQQALQAFLKEQARFYNIERLRLCQKYGVASLQEMDELVAQGRVRRRSS